MSEEQEQRMCITFCVKLGRNGAETFEMLIAAFGEQCLSRARIFEWHKGFKEGRESVDDNPRSGRPTTSKTDDCVARVRELIRANRRLTIRELSVEVGVSNGTTDARFEHATCFCKICSANSHRRTEGMALVCGNKHAA